MNYIKAAKGYLNIPHRNLLSSCVGVCAYLICFSLQAQTNPNWQAVKSSNQIKIYTASVNNYAVKGIKAEVIFEAPIALVLKVATDVKKYPSWIYHCQKTEIIKQVSPTEVIYYHVTDAPWPISDRDQFTLAKLTQENEGSYWLRSQSLANYPLLSPNLVRIKNGHANWHFISLPNGNTKGEYELFFDPEGYIPAWIINLFIEEGPYQTMLSMKKQIQQLNLSK